MSDALRQARDEVARSIGAVVDDAVIGEQPWVYGTVQSTTTGPVSVIVRVVGIGDLRCRYAATYTPAVGDLVALARFASGAYYCTGKLAT